MNKCLLPHPEKDSIDDLKRDSYFNISKFHTHAQCAQAVELWAICPGTGGIV